MDKRQVLLGYGAEKIENSGEIGVPIIYMDAETLEIERERIYGNYLKKRGID